MLDANPDELLLDTLRTLRQTLHSFPEPAGEERQTAEIVRQFLATYEPDELLSEVGGHGVAAVFRGARPGPTVLVRCELDALPVEADEPGLVEDGILEAVAEHRCGHDGHMAIVCGLAPLLHFRPPRRGRVVLLFQPAEETGEGAQRVVDHPSFVGVQPDFVLGLHNLPGFPVGSIIVREGIFSSASVGFRLHLEGKGTHAAEPELGRSPALALAELLDLLPRLEPVGDEGRIVTVTHAHLGRASFGLTPGHAELWATLRAHSAESLGVLRGAAERSAVDIAARHGLAPTLSWHEAFPETRNDSGLVELLERECAKQQLRTIRRDAPFAWSEDFGLFAKRWPSLYFGLGTGEHCAPLHQSGYQFPDACVPTGLKILRPLLARLEEADAQSTARAPSIGVAVAAGDDSANL